VFYGVCSPSLWDRSHWQGSYLRFLGSVADTLIALIYFIKKTKNCFFIFTTKEEAMAGGIFCLLIRRSFSLEAIFNRGYYNIGESVNCGYILFL
jgi:hypothetical protein